MGEHDTLNDALRALVTKLGGSGVIGPRLFPEKPAGAAQRFLIDCLTEDRPARLSPEHLLLLLRIARERGVHDGMAYLSAALGYAEPQPVDPKDELSDLLRQNLEAHKEGQRRQERIERLLMQTSALRSVA